MKNLRKLFLLDPSVVYLNHGSFGATPREVFRAYQVWQRELENQPVEFLGRRFQSLMLNAREILGKYLGTPPENLVFTTNTTESLNIVGRSLELGEGDEVLGTNHEYGAIERLWRFLAKERGFHYNPINLPLSIIKKGEMLDYFWNNISNKTKVISISHITSPTAIIFPVEEIIKKAKSEGIITVIDGAHSPGQISICLQKLGADFYAGNLHKWLCGPKGSAFLYANSNVQHLLKPLIVSWGYESDRPSGNKFIDHHEWTGTRDIAAYLSIPKAIEFQKRNKWENIRAVCNSLITETQQAYSHLTGIESLTGCHFPLQMLSLRLPDWIDINELKNKLYNQYRIEVPIFEWNNINIMRISLQGYNTKQDTDVLLKSLEELGIGKGTRI